MCWRLNLLPKSAGDNIVAESVVLVIGGATNKGKGSHRSTKVS